MYARLRRGSSVYGVDGAIEVSTLSGSSGEVLLSMWPTLAEAGADPGAEWYEAHGGPVGVPVGVAALLCFGPPLRAPVRFACPTGPAGPAGLAGPAGTVRALTLWQPERLSQVVVVLADSVEPIASIEDVGADRIEVYQVLSVQAGTPR